VGFTQRQASLRLWRRTAEALVSFETETGVPIDGVMLVFLGGGYCEHGVLGRHVDAAFPYSWAGILNGPSPVRRRPFRPTLVAWLTGREAALTARGCAGVLLPHASFCASCAARWPGVKLLAMPEMADLSAPKPDDERAAKVRRFAAGRKIVGLLGNIAPRKGVREFLALAQIAARQAPELCFLLAGELSPNSCTPRECRELEAMIATRSANCAFFPERIPEGAEFNALVAACDVIYAVYREFPFNSNLLTKAAHWRRPVLVSADGVMATITRQYRTGAVVAGDQPGETLAVVQNLLRGLDGDGRPADADYSGLEAENSTERLPVVLSGLVAKWAARQTGGRPA
jgi:glycosyltransferase involved in cell wall biosynthesis